MSTRRCSSSRGRGGLYVRGRKKKAKVCLAKKENNATKASSSSSLQRKLKQLQRTVPGSHGGMDVQALFQSIQNYIVLLEAKVRILRSLTSFYGV